MAGNQSVPWSSAFGALTVNSDASTLEGFFPGCGGQLDRRRQASEILARNDRTDKTIVQIEVHNHANRSDKHLQSLAAGYRLYREVTLASRSFLRQENVDFSTERRRERLAHNP